MSPARSREPLERDTQGRRILTHDRGGYARGCRCDECTEDHATAGRDQRAARSARNPDSARRAAAQRPGWDRRDRLTVEIHYRVTEETAAQLDSLIWGKATRNTVARDFMLDALHDELKRQEGNTK